MCITNQSFSSYVSYLSSSPSSNSNTKTYASLYVDPKPTFIIDKIMHLYGVTKFMISYVSEHIEVDNNKMPILHGIDIYISYNNGTSCSSYANNMLFGHDVPKVFEQLITMYLSIDTPFLVTYLHTLFNESSKNPHLMKQFIDNALENASNRGISTYMQKANTDPFDIECVWPAFYTRDQMQIDLDLKSPFV